MNPVLIFQEFCESISKESGRKKKEQLAEEFKLRLDLLDAGTQRAFQDFLLLAYHPKNQFFLELEPSDEPETEQFRLDCLERFILELQHKMLTVQEANSIARVQFYGKWTRRVINKNLNLGIGVKTINRIFGYTIPEFPWEQPEKLILEPPLDWESLYYELKPPCYLIPMPDGIQVMFHKIGEKVFPFSLFGFPLKNTEKFEQQILETFVGVSEVQVFGKLSCGGSNREVEVFSKAEHKAEAEEAGFEAAYAISNGKIVLNDMIMTNPIFLADFKQPFPNVSYAIEKVNEFWIFEEPTQKFYRTKLPALPKEQQTLPTE